MSQAHSIQADNKPTLFTWDIETEYQNIDRWLSSERKTDPAILERKRSQLRQLKLDFHNIIISKAVNEMQIDSIFKLARQGQSGIWEQVTTIIEKMAFHFDAVKNRLTIELRDSDSTYVSKLVTCIGDFYTKEELAENLRHLLKLETNERLIELFDFVLMYIDTPKGGLTIAANPRSF
jgi:hypothetical protein